MKENSRNWRFTWNTYPENWETVATDALADLEVATGNSVRYAVFGIERGEVTDRPHIQGHVTFKHKVNRGDIKEHLFQAYWRTAQSPAQSIEYCKKDGDYTELGDTPTRYGG